MRVLKFGGTSVRDAEWMDKALDIAISQLDHGVVIVSSATTKTTDRLQEMANLAAKGQKDKAEELLGVVEEFHLNESAKFLTGQNLAKCQQDLKKLFSELRSIVLGLSLLKECTPRSNDLILSFGERVSTTMMALRAKEKKIDAEFLDARDFIKTNEQFTSAIPLEELTNKLTQEMVKPAPGRILVTQGFIGSTTQGITTTLGRGGSDYTATIIGAALKAEEVQIWTDVDGIMTCDPRLIPKATTIPTISYKEAAELAYFGAKVIHPSTIQPAIALGIPVDVRNTGNPDFAGTRIIANVPAEGPKAIAFKKNITVINITSGRMFMAYGFLRKIFEIFDKYKTPVDTIATSEVSVSVTIDNLTYLAEIEKELNTLGTVLVEQERCLVCLVGQDLWKNSIFISRVFKTLDSISVRMISLGASDTNLSLVVSSKFLEDTVKRLHYEFFEQ